MLYNDETDTHSKGTGSREFHQRNINIQHSKAKQRRLQHINDGANAPWKK